VLAVDLLVGALGYGDYVVEVQVASASGSRTTMVPFRVVP
jgi:hypothetical protein